MEVTWSLSLYDDAMVEIQLRCWASDWQLYDCTIVSLPPLQMNRYHKDKQALGRMGGWTDRQTDGQTAGHMTTVHCIWCVQLLCCVCSTVEEHLGVKWSDMQVVTLTLWEWLWRAGRNMKMSLGKLQQGSVMWASKRLDWLSQRICDCLIVQIRIIMMDNDNPALASQHKSGCISLLHSRWLLSLDMVSIGGKQLEALRLVLDHLSQFYSVLARRLPWYTVVSLDIRADFAVVLHCCSSQYITLRKVKKGSILFSCVRSDKEVWSASRRGSTSLYHTGCSWFLNLPHFDPVCIVKCTWPSFSIHPVISSAFD